MSLGLWPAIPVTRSDHGQSPLPSSGGGGGALSLSHTHTRSSRFSQRWTPFSVLAHSLPPSPALPFLPSLTPRSPPEISRLASVGRSD